MKRLNLTIISLFFTICFSCKNSNIDSVNSDTKAIENNPQSEPQQLEDWTDSNENTESNQDVSNEDYSTTEYPEENIERCSECNIELVTPGIRACYICNRDFSGWGFVIRDGSIDNEQMQSIVNCFPGIYIHNSLSWRIYEDACCSRKCAMDL